MKSIRIFLYGAILLTCCTDHEELTQRDYPLVTTFEVDNITKSGAQFRGKVSGMGNDKVLEHGFVWGDIPDVALESDDKTALGKIDQDDEFSNDIRTTLEEGKTYYVRAYVKTARHTVYGRVVSFVSLGSKAPTIKSFNPKKGYILDTIQIRGSGFSFINDKNIVKFDKVKAIVISQTDSLLSVQVPANLMTVKSKITVSIIGNVATSGEDFELTGAQITSVSPITVTACDTITIIGNHFSQNILALKVKLDNTECRIIENSTTQIKAVVPVFSPTNELVNISVISSNIQTIFTEKITYKKPQFIGLKARTNTTFNDTLVIKGKNFPRCHPVTIKLGTVTQSILTSNDSVISFKIPESVTTSQNDLSVTFNNTGLVYNSVVTLSPPKIISVSPASGTFADIVTITGMNFHPQKANNLISIGYASANAITAQSTKITLAIPLEARGCDVCNLISVQVNDQAITSEVNLFTLLPPVLTGVSPEVLTSPGPVTLTGNYFNPHASYNTVYIGNEASVINATKNQIIANVDLNTLTNYDPYLSSSRWADVRVETGGQTTTPFSFSINFNYKGPWTKKSDFPGTARLYPISVVINNKLYTGLGRNSSGQLLNDFWEYDPSTDTWTQRASFPGSGRLEATTFVLDNNAYLGLGVAETLPRLKDFWTYDPVSNTWTQLNDFSGSERSNAEAFVINNKAYVAGGLGKIDVWIYNKASDSWMQLQNAPVSIVRQNHFVIGDNAYHVRSVGFGIHIYEYNSTNDQWTLKLTDISRTYASPVALPGGYIYDYQAPFVRYNIGSNTLSFLEARASRRLEGNGAGIGNKQYVFAGYRIVQIHPNQITQIYNDLWEFDYAAYP